MSRERTVSPNPEALALMETLIEKHSNVADVVLDTFAGSAATLLAPKIYNVDSLGVN